MKKITKKRTIARKNNANKIDLKSARFLVTGGSGSFGRNIIKKLLALGARNILSISRNEDLIKQAETDVGSPFVKFKLGDITDKEFINNIMKEVDVVFHTAAIKHVSLAEQNPREAYRSNILGLLNVLNSSTSIKRFVHISSDKAIGVTNCYGATKLLGEYLVKESNDINRGNIYAVIRCPNLFGSRGSVLDAWAQQLKKNNTIRISDPEMTRYFITLSDAADFVVDIALMDNVDTKEIHYPLKFTKKFRLKDLAEAFLKVRGNKNSSIEIIGVSPGEKKHEDYIADVPLCSVAELVTFLKTTN
ncbi:MAG: Polysaccharide biosynthesis protein CapD [Parcubacteria group bacterium GW2011_GWA1_40_21]|nr:MAG: Polysaccharide biosynthesis protein CapD [Parcubacteria group bacterium GW2011_GWC1_40_13]KKR53182.1 MAG: Polysaccharide biosynthesis protein CapD [Parcubacteria group bacterium GW2011_GWA1_40_21]